MAIGWIKLSRQIQECDLLWDSFDEPFDRRSAWIDLLLMANHRDKEIMFNGKTIIVERGQRITSMRALAEKWHWSREKVKRYLDLLESENMIIRESDRRRTLLTIVNYSKFQDEQATDEPPIEPQNEPQNEPQKSHRQSHRQVINKNDKNDKNDKNTPLYPPKGGSRRRPRKPRNEFKEMLDTFYGTEVLPTLPASFAEAACMLSEMDSGYWKRVGVSQSLYNRYRDFKKRIGTGLSMDRFRDTFWYYIMRVNSQ